MKEPWRREEESTPGGWALSTAGPGQANTEGWGVEAGKSTS